MESLMKEVKIKEHQYPLFIIYFYFQFSRWIALGQCIFLNELLVQTEQFGHLTIPLHRSKQQVLQMMVYLFQMKWSLLKRKLRLWRTENTENSKIEKKSMWNYWYETVLPSICRKWSCSTRYMWRQGTSTQ